MTLMTRTTTVVGLFASLAMLSGCERSLPKAKADAVLIELAPDVVSSEDGSLHVRATVVSGGTTLRGWTVRLQVVFEDQLGRVRAAPGLTAETDRTGAVEHVFAGLIWAGAGTVTAEVLDGDGEPYLRGGEPVASEATFAVIDLSPPTAVILPPSVDLKVGPNLPFDLIVQFTDEIGVSRVTAQAVGELQDQDTQIVASGSTNGSVTFEFDVPGGAISGPTITLYALVEDLSGNITAADPIILTVDPTILFAVPPPLAGSLLVTGNGNFLQNPRALAMSPADDLLYVADNSGGACGGQCIWQINPANGAAVLVTIGVGTIEGVAFNADGTFLFYTDRNDRIVRLTYNPGVTAHYENPIGCTFLAGNPPQDPFHLWIDGTTALFPELANQTLQTLDVSACTGAAEATDPADLSAGLDTPYGVTQIPAGDYLVSDVADDVVYRVTAAGVTTVFESARMDEPVGMDWLAGGDSTYADSVFVANRGSQRVLSSRGGNTSRTAVSLVPDPIDVAFGVGAYEGTLYVLTVPGAQGRIFAITGF